MEKLNWHKSSGIIKYDPPRPGMAKRTSWWAIVKVDREITRYYRWWIDKEIQNPLGMTYVEGSIKRYSHDTLVQPSWDAHISIIRGEEPKDDLKRLWKKHDGERVDFLYKHNPRQTGNTTKGDRPDHYWFVDVFSPRLDEIRSELHLVTGWKYHLTVGRTW